MSQDRGRIILFPVPMGDVSPAQVLPASNIRMLAGVRHFVVENIRSARRFLRAAISDFDIDGSSFTELSEHTPKADVVAMLAPALEGSDIGVISEAGCPAVADPGADIVAIAQREGLRVVPLVGPSSILLAVMASGFNGQSFAFHGYLPIDPSQRAKRLKQLEARAVSEGQTQLFIETPYRNARLFADICSACNPQTRLCIAAGLTTEDEYVRTRTLREWKKQGMPDLGKIPAIFLIYK